MRHTSELVRRIEINHKSLSTHPSCKIPFQHTSKHTMMDTRREYDKKMKGECIWGAVAMVVAFVMVIMAMQIWG